MKFSLFLSFIIMSFSAFATTDMLGCSNTKRWQCTIKVAGIVEEADSQANFDLPDSEWFLIANDFTRTDITRMGAMNKLKALCQNAFTGWDDGRSTLRMAGDEKVTKPFSTRTERNKIILHNMQLCKRLLSSDVDCEISL